MIRVLLASLTLLLAAPAAANPADVGAVVGKPAPVFAATDNKGKPVRLADLRGKYVVLEWFNPECPFSVKHYSGGNMQGLQRDFGAKGVHWISIQTFPPGKVDVKGVASWQAEVKAKPANVLLDGGGKLGHLYGAKTTPHMYVIDPKGVLIYAGAIDDKRSADPGDIPTSRNHVRMALDEALAGKPVTTSSTQPYGCTVKYE